MSTLESFPQPVPSHPAALGEHVRNWIQRELATLPERGLDVDTPLFESLLDSTSVLALVSYLEESLHIEIRDSEVVPANFSTLRRLEAYLQRKLRPEATQAMAGGRNPQSA